MIFRLTYLRNGAERRVTFYAADLVAAADWAERYAAMAEVEPILMVPCRNRWARRGGRLRRLRENSPILGNSSGS